MIKQFLLFSVVCLFTAGLFADDHSQSVAASLRDQGLASNRSWDIVESLTTEIGPRLAGTKADAKAVTWAKELMENSVFDRVWLEPVTFPIWQRHKEIARVISPFPQPLVISALGYSGSTNGEISGEIILFEDLRALRDAPRGSLKNKIVFINKKTDRHRDGRGYAMTVSMRYKAGRLAQEHGAIAALIRSVGTDSQRFAHTGASEQLETRFPAAALSAPDADQLVRMLARDVPVTVALDIDVSQQNNGKSYNVIGQIDGREKPDELILIGAHLDSWDLGTGAIDDGAGVGITVAAAELIGNLSQRPRRSVRVVLFANEEQGLWGAKQYTEKHLDELPKHIFASESDFGADLIWRFDTSSQRLMAAAMPVLAELNIEQGGKTNDGGPDITPLAKKKVPVFRLKQNGIDYFDYHHTADDTLDKINPEKMKQNVAAWAAVTYLAAEID